MVVFPRWFLLVAGSFCLLASSTGWRRVLDGFFSSWFLMLLLLIVLLPLLLLVPNRVGLSDLFGAFW